MPTSCCIGVSRAWLARTSALLLRIGPGFGSWLMSTSDLASEALLIGSGCIIAAVMHFDCSNVLVQWMLTWLSHTLFALLNLYGSWMTCTNLRTRSGSNGAVAEIFTNRLWRNGGTWRKRWVAKLVIPMMTIGPVDWCPLACNLCKLLQYLPRPARYRIRMTSS